MFYAPIDSTDAGDRVTRELRVGAVPGFMGAFVLLDGVGKGRGRKSQGEKLFKKKQPLTAFPFFNVYFSWAHSITFIFLLLRYFALPSNCFNRLSGGEGGKICIAIWHMLKIFSVQL